VKRYLPADILTENKELGRKRSSFRRAVVAQPPCHYAFYYL